jgi:hypothetical protein
MDIAQVERWLALNLNYRPHQDPCENQGVVALSPHNFFMTLFLNGKLIRSTMNKVIDADRSLI